MRRKQTVHLHPRYKKKNDFNFYKIGFFVLALILVFFIFSQSGEKSIQEKSSNDTFISKLSLLKDKISMGTTNTKYPDDLIFKSCMNSYESCVEISERKYDIYVNLLEVEKFEDKSEASVFFETWNGWTQLGLDFELRSVGKSFEKDLPFTLFAIKFTNQEGTKIPVTLICDKTGKLVSSSKSLLDC
jgi:hypothetical protein